jgi:hypothetical protein
MQPLTNSQIFAARTPAQVAAARGGLGDVQQNYNYGRLGVYWTGNSAEVRDTHGNVLKTGTPKACRQWAKANR